jgi:hypothetical protein
MAWVPTHPAQHLRQQNYAHMCNSLLYQAIRLKLALWHAVTITDLQAQLGAAQGTQATAPTVTEAGSGVISPVSFVPASANGALANAPGVVQGTNGAAAMVPSGGGAAPSNAHSMLTSNGASVLVLLLALAAPLVLALS